MILLAAALIGMGSSVFHPEASRVARMASGGRYGLAQSLFQVGGNMGSAAGPLLAAFIVVPHGQHSIVWFSAAALVAMIVLFQVGGWYARRRAEQKPAARKAATTAAAPALSRGACRRRCRHPGGAALLQERLQRQPRLLLHALSDGQVRHRRGDGAVLPVRLPGRHRRRHHRRRRGRRQGRPHPGDVVLDPGRAALRPDAALRQSLLDRRARRSRWP